MPSLRRCSSPADMSDPFLTEMQARLRALRRELESLVSTSKRSSQVVELDQARVGRLSRVDALQGQAMAHATGRRRAVMLQKIDAALARIDNGDYGLCRSCDEPIDQRRLELDPSAALCIDCAQRAEQ